MLPMNNLAEGLSLLSWKEPVVSIVVRCATVACPFWDGPSHIPCEGSLGCVAAGSWLRGAGTA